MRIFGKRRFVLLGLSWLWRCWWSSVEYVKVGLEFSLQVLFAGLRRLRVSLYVVVVGLV